MGTDAIVGISSILLRLSAYLFLRWIPAYGLVTVAFASFIAYASSAFLNFMQSEPYKVVADHIDIVTREIHGSLDTEDLDPTLGSAVIKELDIDETLILEQKDPRPLRTLLTGIPSPSSLIWSLLTFLINLAAFLMVADFIYRAPYLHPSHSLSFARVGYVSDSTAKILTREPSYSHHPVRLHYRYADILPASHQDLDATWKSAGSLSTLDDTTDFTGTFHVTRLRPETRYQYTLSNHHSGFFTTAPRPGLASARKRDSFTFIHSSCVLANYPYSPFRNPLSLPGLKHLAALLPKLRPQFMLFLGDFIYIDVPRRHGTDKEAYRREYRQVYSSPGWPSVSTDTGIDLPWIHVYDDHEISNDWDRNDTGLYPAAADAWHHYHASINPPSVRANSTYFSFVQGPASFFMIDTRKHRTPFDSTNGTWDRRHSFKDDTPLKSMLGTQQRLDVLNWLARPEHPGVRWKILVSSIPFTKNWKFGSEDTWAGYLGERQVLLEAMWDVASSEAGIGVIIISGDRHEFAATAFPPPVDGGESALKKHWPVSATVHEFSVSPLSMFYLPIRTYRPSPEHDATDVCIKYLPDGNSKFGALSFTAPEGSDQSILHYRLFVDGRQTWSYVLTTPPVGGGSAREKEAMWG